MGASERGGSGTGWRRGWRGCGGACEAGGERLPGARREAGRVLPLVALKGRLGWLAFPFQ